MRFKNDIQLFLNRLIKTFVIIYFERKIYIYKTSITKCNVNIIYVYNIM